MIFFKLNNICNTFFPFIDYGVAVLSQIKSMCIFSILNLTIDVTERSLNEMLDFVEEYKKDVSSH